MTDLVPAPDGYPIKLVRDLTPAIINSTGDPGDLFYAELPADEREEWLHKKLVEEVAEYVVKPSAKELGDVLAVVAALASFHTSELTRPGELLDRDGAVNRLYIDYVREHPRGAFEDGVMMYGRHPEFDVADPDNRLGRQ